MPILFKYERYNYNYIRYISIKIAYNKVIMFSNNINSLYIYFFFYRKQCLLLLISYLINYSILTSD